MYLTFGFVVWRAFLLSLDDIVGMVAALSFGLWVLDVDDDGCWDEVWRGLDTTGQDKAHRTRAEIMTENGNVKYSVIVFLGGWQLSGHTLS